jgi:hypothetical protein
MVSTGIEMRPLKLMYLARYLTAAGSALIRLARFSRARSLPRLSPAARYRAMTSRRSADLASCA